MKHISISIFFSVFLSLAGVVIAQEAGKSKKAEYNFSSLQQKIRAWVDSGYYNGASIIVAKDDKVIYKDYFGVYKPETVVFIASAGKWLAAATIASIVDDGKLNWNDKVKKWLPEFTDIKGEATLAQLLSHTAGYPDYQPKGKPVDIYQTLSESVAHISRLAADTLPRTKFKYGGLSMQVAGRMAELATGKDWETLFREKIALPLEMHSTHFVPVDSSGGHSPMLGGGARTILQEYANFLSMILNNGVFKGKRVLSQDAISNMQADQVGAAGVNSGEFVERARGRLGKDIYGLGEWREEVNAEGIATLISSPSWAGAYPWIDKEYNVYGFFLTHISKPKKGFSSFYASPVLVMLTRDVLSNKKTGSSAANHPRLYASDKDRPAILQKIKNEPWATDGWNSLKKSIDKYVDRHVTDPKWIVSRFAMYWKEGERYTQCYIKKQNWDYGEGNAPVPTVRLPGMRIWNDYGNVPLEDRIPYNETGDMKAISRKNPAASPVIVPYKNSGHLIRGNNVEILTLAEKSAFAYWITGEEKYAKFAADIFYTWLIGTYYMNPPYDPSFMKSGYDPGGIFGYYDYEQIHDDLAMHAAPVYDFLYDYLNAHPHDHLKTINKGLPEVASTVFKRFIDIGFVRGNKRGNWNVNGWNIMMRPILVLESNDRYADQKGREYYLHYFTTESTKYHDALPDIVKSYDPVTGLWPESPGYAFGTINTLLDLSVPLYLAGVNIVEQNPVLQKAALAVFPWMDARGNMVVFGDSRGGPADFVTFERLLTYYSFKNDKENAAIAAAALQKGIASGQYKRGKADWTDLCINVPLISTSADLPAARMAWSAEHRHLVMKNGNDEKSGLMATLYGGTAGKHLSANGLALQLYGKGWALAPDASAYESYWSADRGYHQSATGANTILPGYTEGPVTINAMEPAVPDNSFTNKEEISPYCSFADISAKEKRRMVGIIRTSDSTGYYIDIFHSDQDNNDYLWHNLGNTLSVTDSLTAFLPFQTVNDLDTVYSRDYAFFKDQRKALYNGDLHAQWTIVNSPRRPVHMQMWMKGNPGRQIYTVNAPPTTLNRSVVPAGVNMSPETTPVLIVRQNSTNASRSPFVALFEPYEGGNRSVKNTRFLPAGDGVTALLVESNPLNEKLEGRKEYIFYSVDQKPLDQKDIQFEGLYGVVSENKSGLQYLYLGKGRTIGKGRYRIHAEGDVSAELICTNGKLYYSASGPVTISIPGRAGNKNSRLYYKNNGSFSEAGTIAGSSPGVIVAKLPAGYHVELLVK